MTDLAQVHLLHPRKIIEKSRDFARHSRDAMLPRLKQALTSIPPGKSRDYLYQQEQEHRMELVMDAYNTGAAEMLKMLFGDFSPEPWADEYNHEKRLHELLTTYRLLVTSNGTDPASESTPEANA